MSTVYITHVLHVTATGHEVDAELRIEPTDGVDNHLDVGTYDYDSGDELGRVELDRDTAAKLRAALSDWLDT